MEQDPTSPPPSSDLRGLLIVVGVLMCLAGVSCGGTAWLMAPLDSTESPEVSLWLDALFWLLTGAATVWLGIGLIRCRRWAWKLSFTLGWVWVGVTVIITISFTSLAPAFLGATNEMVAEVVASLGSPGTGSAFPPLRVLQIAGGMIVGLLAVSLPGVVLIVIFSLRNVRLTCQYRDPVPRWTDRLPVAVLALWLVIAFEVVNSLTVHPIWRQLASGGLDDPSLVVPIAACVLGAILCGFSAVHLSRMRLSGWVLGFCGILLLGIAGAFSMSEFEAVAMDEIAMDDTNRKYYELINQMPFWRIPVAYYSIILLYMLCILRYFMNRSAVAAGAGDGQSFNPTGLT